MQQSTDSSFAKRPDPDIHAPPPRYSAISDAATVSPQPAQDAGTCPYCLECNLQPSAPRIGTIVTLSALSTLSFGIFWVSAHFLSSSYADESVQNAGSDGVITPSPFVKRTLLLVRRGAGGSIGGNFMLFFLVGGLGTALVVGLVLGWYLQYRTDRNQRIWMKERAVGRGTIQRSAGRVV